MIDEAEGVELELLAPVDDWFDAILVVDTDISLLLFVIIFNGLELLFIKVEQVFVVVLVVCCCELGEVVFVVTKSQSCWPFSLFINIL